MALKKTFAERLFNISKASGQVLTNCRISNTSATRTRISQNPTRPDIAPDPGDSGVFRRFLHKRAVINPSISAFLGGGNLKEGLRTIDIARDRIRLDGLIPPPPNTESEKAEGLTVTETKKVLRVFQMEMIKERLRMTEKSWVTYTEFIRVCEDCCLNREKGLEYAKLLDESGTVIVLGNVVFLSPEQVTKALECLIPFPVTNPHDPRRTEFEEMEKQKSIIDKKADTLVRRQLWSGLGYFVLQTAAFVRLTFWELSWDVMEPICFYVTSTSVMGGYLFFLMTAKEPTFESFYKSRFSSKQKKLMKIHNFDVERYRELRKIFYPYYSTASELT